MVTRAESLEAEQASLLTKLFQKNLPHCRPYLWNIPAYAGKTLSPMASAFAGTEHPRVCGENSGYMRSDFAGVGTSPRMRGKPTGAPRPDRNPRNIPAYAGKTCRPRSRVVRNSEHPRVCGENMITSSNGLTQAGTSPRMRGKRCAFAS